MTSSDPYLHILHIFTTVLRMQKKWSKGFKKGNSGGQWVGRL